MTQLRMKELLGRANLLLDKGFHFPLGFVTVKSSEMESLLDRIDASIPEDIKEAELILRRREEIQADAQRRADRIIADAQNEANRILSESELLRAVEQKAAKIKEEVINDCEDIRNKAMSDAENLRIQAHEEAQKIKEGAENYAEQILNNIDTDLTQLQQIVHNGQAFLEKQRMETYKNSPINTIYKNQETEFDVDYIMQ